MGILGILFTEATFFLLLNLNVTHDWGSKFGEILVSFRIFFNQILLLGDNLSKLGIGLSVLKTKKNQVQISNVINMILKRDFFGVFATICITDVTWVEIWINLQPVEQFSHQLKKFACKNLISTQTSFCHPVYTLH